MPWLPFLVQMLIGVGLQIVGYILMGQAKQDKTNDVKDFDTPTAEAGRPIPVLFGELEITGLNCIWHGEKSSKTYKVNA